MEDAARPNDGKPTHTGEAQNDEPNDSAGGKKNPPAGAGSSAESGSKNPGDLSDDEILERADAIKKTRAAQANEI